MRFRQPGLSGRTKGGRSSGTPGRPAHSLNVLQFSSGAQKTFTPPAVKLVDGEPWKSPAIQSPHKLQHWLWGGRKGLQLCDFFIFFPDIWTRINKLVNFMWASMCLKFIMLALKIINILYVNLFLFQGVPRLTLNVCNRCNKERNSKMPSNYTRSWSFLTLCKFMKLANDEVAT